MILLALVLVLSIRLQWKKFKGKFDGAYFKPFEKVSGGSLGESILCAINTSYFDYHLSEMYERYKEYVPAGRQEILLKEILLSKGDGLSPLHLTEFLQYFDKYFLEHEIDDQYFYSLYQDGSNLSLDTLARIKINGKTHKVSTGHTTYKDNTDNHDFAEITNTTDKSKPTWMPLHDQLRLKGDDRTLYFGRIYYRDAVKNMFGNLYKLCELASELDLEIKCNIEW